MNNDLISRSELKKAIYKLYDETLDGIVKFGIEKAYEIIDNAPTIEIPNYGGQIVPDVLQGWKYEERPQGEWVVDDWSKIIECNKCRGQAPIDITSGEQYRSNFCPICGADMRKEDKK